MNNKIMKYLRGILYATVLIMQGFWAIPVSSGELILEG